MVVAHTVQPEVLHRHAMASGRVDVGMSAHYGGSAANFEIVGECYAH